MWSWDVPNWYAHLMTRIARWMENKVLFLFGGEGGGVVRVHRARDCTHMFVIALYNFKSNIKKLNKHEAIFAAIKFLMS